MFKVGDRITYETIDSNARLEGVIVEVDENDDYQPYLVEGPYNRNRYWPLTETVRPYNEEEDEDEDEEISISKNYLVARLTEIHETLYWARESASPQTLERGMQELEALIKELKED